MLIINQKTISWLNALLVLSFLTVGCVNLQKAEWENKPIAGEVLGTHYLQSQTGPPTTKLVIRLDSGKVVLVRSPKDELIIKGQKLKLYRGKTQIGQKIYSLAPPFQFE